MAIFLPWLIIKLSYFCSFHQPHSNGVSCWVRMGLHSNNTDKKKDSNNNNNNNKFISLLKYFRENSIRKKRSLPRKFEVFHIFILFYYTSSFINYCQERLVIPECDKVKHVQSNLSTKATLGIEIRNHCRSIMWQLGEKGHSTVIFNVNKNGVTIPHPKTSVTLHLLCILPVKVTSLQCIINCTSIPKVPIGKRFDHSFEVLQPWDRYWQVKFIPWKKHFDGGEYFYTHKRPKLCTDFFLSKSKIPIGTTLFTSQSDS